MGETSQSEKVDQSDFPVQFHEFLKQCLHRHESNKYLLLSLAIAILKT
jgi:hypothetical protein